MPAVAAAAERRPGPVTVTITNWNGAAFLDDCLDAVAGLRGDVAEVIVVDNASSDDSQARVMRRGGGVRLVAMARNEGPCPARNRGLAEARTRWVLQLDSDVIVQPDTLERLWPETAGERVVAIQPRAVLASDPRVVHYDGGAMHYVGMLVLDRFLQVLPEGDNLPAGDVDAVISMALLLDRDVVLGIGGYDPAFFILFEDHDLSYRLRARGWRLRRVTQAVVAHREGTVGLSFRPGAPVYPGRRAFLHARNRAYLVAKNYSWPALLATLPGRCAYAAAYMLFALTRGVFGSWLRGELDVLRLAPRALRLRRQTARERQVSDRELLGSGDLSVAPHIARSALERRAERVFNGLLRGWWVLARRLIPAGRSGHGAR